MMFRRRIIMSGNSGVTVKVLREGYAVSGVPVTVGGKTVTTGNDGIAVFNVSGNITVSILKSTTYSAYSKSYNVTTGSVIDVSLQALYVLKIRTQTGNLIQLTGAVNKSQQTTQVETTFSDIPKGDVRYTISKGGFVSETGVVSFSGNISEKTINVTLLQTAAVGDFVYSDGSYSSSLNTSKICVGICFYSMGTDRRMVNLNNLKTNFSSDYPNLCYYGPNETVSGVVTTADQTTAEGDMNGKANTLAALAKNTTLYPQAMVFSDYPMANYCNNYSVDGYGRGKWWLFSLGELKQINISRSLINARLSQVGGDEVLVADTPMLISSTQHSANKMWGLMFLGQIGVVSFEKEGTRTGIRPVTSF